MSKETKKGLKKANSNSVLRQVISGYKKDSDKRGHIFELTNDECFKLFKQRCYYCGGGASNLRRYSKDKTIIAKYNGIDRVDNSKGYVSNNVVSCCKRCNRAKDTMSKEEFFGLIKNIYDNMGMCKNKKI